MIAARWSVAQRLVQALFALPEGWVRRWLGPPVERDGRRLDRHVQLLLALGERSGQTRRELTVAAMRQSLRSLSALGMPKFPDIAVSDRQIDGPSASIRVRVYRAPNTPTPAPGILYFHGGGWVCGNLDSHDSTCRLLADSSRCVVVAVEYRLAPEHPYPAAVDDAVAAWGWIGERATELAIEPGRIGVMGDSAGGNLAAVLCLAARDAVLPLPVAQGLIYPALDMEFSAASHESLATGFGLERRTMEWFRAQYAPDPSSWREPRISPLHAQDLAGLPPALVVTAGFDPLRDDGDAYAAALLRAGVAVEHRRYDDAIHGFFGMGILPGGLARAQEIGAAMGTQMQNRAEEEGRC